MVKRYKDDKDLRTEKKFVFPGEKLGVIEEFVPGSGTFTEEGNIYSSQIGLLNMDTLNKEVFIHAQTRSPLIPQKDDIVIGRVSYIQDKTLTLKIFQINNKILKTSFSGVLHVSNATRSYLKTLHDGFKPGDIVRAKVLALMNREIHLSTEERYLGVLQTLCSHCGHQVSIVNKRLTCPLCNKNEKRKIAIDYGK